MLFRLRGGLDADFLLVVEIPLAGGEHDIVDPWLHHLHKRAVALHAEFFVGAVATHQIHLCGRQFIAFHFVHPSFDGLHDFRFLKTVNVVPASGIPTVRREEATVVRPLESHAKIVTL